MNEKIVILMSTYNGQEYLRMQLDSILNQTYKNLEIIIRDDGSSDDTIEILKEYSQKYSNISFYCGNNLKPAKSFLHLIKNVKNDAEYYAFADQDDVWNDNKIEVAIDYLKTNSNIVPKLYFSDTILVDKDLNELTNLKKIISRKITLGNALIENVVTGCTCVFNRELKLLLEKIELEDVKCGYYHDSLAYRICSCVGEVYYDSIPHILYRQHPKNVIGNSNTLFNKVLKRKKNINNTINLRSSMAAYIYNKYIDEINEENIETIKLIAFYKKNLKNRLKLFLNFKISRISIVDDLLYRIGILLGKI